MGMSIILSTLRSAATATTAKRLNEEEQSLGLMCSNGFDYPAATNSFFSFSNLAVIGGAVVGLLCAILVVMFIVYRMRKKDEGSYALDEPKRSPAVNSYAKNTNNREFYA